MREHCRSLEELRFDIILNSSIFNGCDLFNYQHFHHYTDKNAVSHILAEDYINLRLTSANSVRGDKSEGFHMLPIFKSACDTLLCTNCIDKPFYEKIYDCHPIATDHFYNAKYECIRINPTPYLFCFSTAENSEYLWSTYADQKRGYCMDLATFCIDSYFGTLSPLNNFIFVYLSKVLYDPEFLKQGYCEAIKRLYSFWEEDNSDIITNTLSNLLAMSQYIYKDNIYSIENEIRLIVFVPDDQSALSDCDSVSIEENSKYIYIKTPKIIESNITLECLRNYKDNDKTLSSSDDAFIMEIRNRNYPLNC